MPTIFSILLTIHIILGVAAIVFLWTIWSKLKSEYNIKALKIYSVSGTISLFLSWLTGGYYYLYRYGGEVKPQILEGSQPWAHKFPFLAIVITVIMFKYGDDLENDQRLKQLLSRLSLVAATLSALMAIMGFIISSAH